MSTIYGEGYVADRMPERIQLKRTKGWKMPPNTVKVDRTTKWGNPWTAENSGRVDPALRFACETAPLMDLSELRGKNLACWCKPGASCHADVLLELANAGVAPTPDAQQLVDACAPFLKDGETPAECIERNRKDADAVLSLLAKERRRFEWLHSPESHAVDGYEWGIYRVKYDSHGQPVEMRQTNSDLSDLDAAIESSSAAGVKTPDGGQQ